MVKARLMPWFRAVMTYMRAFLTHRNTVTTAVKRVAGASCATEAEKREVLRADLERNVSLCLHNRF